VKPIVIEIIPNTSVDEAKRLIKRGGKCGSIEVLGEVCSLLGESKRRKNVVFTKTECGTTKTFSANVIWCALIDQKFEIRPPK